MRRDALKVKFPIWLSKFSVWCAVVASAVMLVAAFPPFDCGLLAWFALTPFLFIIYHDAKPRDALNYGFLLGLMFYLGTLYWFYYAVGILGFLLLAILSLFPAIASCLIAYVRQKLGLKAAVLLTPVIWTGVEYFRCELWPLKFSWMALGYSQYQNTGIIQFADIAGVYGISFVLASAAAAIAFLSYTLYKFKSVDSPGSVRVSLILTACVTGAVTLIVLYGNMCMSRDYSIGKPIKFKGVQIEMYSPELFNNTQPKNASKASDVKIVVWPEYSLSLFVDESNIDLKRIEGMAKKYHIYILFGGKEKAGEGNDNTSFYNTAFLVSPEGRIIGRARKMNPIQFFSDGLPGMDYSVLNTDFARLGVGICYDMDYTYVSRNLTSRGADILVFPTLDVSTWGRVEHLQHASMTPFRAIENRRFVFRVAGSGISQMVDSHGLIVDSRDINFSGAFVSSVRKSDYMTFYGRFGYLFSWMCLAGTIVTGIITLIKSRSGQ